MAIFGVCPKCKEFKKLTKHHIYPRRIYNGEYSSHILMICRQDHDALERLIPFAQQPHSFYKEIISSFLGKRNTG